MRAHHFVFGFALTAVAIVTAACGGGGGGTSGGGGVVPATPTPNTISGTAADFASGAALGGFTVTIGNVPNALTCNAGQTATTVRCASIAFIAEWRYNTTKLLG